jgi:hypothetical protein
VGLAPGFEMLDIGIVGAQSGRRKSPLKSSKMVSPSDIFGTHILHYKCKI